MSGSEPAHVEIIMPRLSDSMDEGTIVAWLKQPGDAVTRGEALVEVETDKATIVHDRDVNGTLSRSWCRKGNPQPWVRRSRHRHPRSGLAAIALLPRGARLRLGRGSSAVKSGTRWSDSCRSSASGRLGVPLEGINGNKARRPHREGRLVARRRPSCLSPATRRWCRSGVRRPPDGDAAHDREGATVESRSTIPDFSVASDVDMTAAIQLRGKLHRLESSTRISVNDMVVKAVALALRRVGALNASVTDDAIVRHDRINIGVAISAQDALFVPTLFDADTMPLATIGTEIRRLAEGARARSLTLAGSRAGRSQSSNLGMYDIPEFTAVINPPQVAILAVGTAMARAVVDPQGQFVARRVMRVTLSCDHRVVYGADAARFLGAFRELVEHPEALVDSPVSPDHTV